MPLKITQQISFTLLKVWRLRGVSTGRRTCKSSGAQQDAFDSGDEGPRADEDGAGRCGGEPPLQPEL